MKKEKSNIELLRELFHSKREPFDPIEAELLLDKIKADLTTMAIMCTEAEDEVDSYVSVDCGIGKIEWRSDSLVLQSKMEEFTNKIASSYIQNQVTLF